MVRHTQKIRRPLPKFVALALLGLREGVSDINPFQTSVSFLYFAKELLTEFFSLESKISSIGHLNKGQRFIILNSRLCWSSLRINGFTISIPQITWVLLANVVILSKTNPCSGRKKQERQW